VSFNLRKKKQKTMESKNDGTKTMRLLL